MPVYYYHIQHRYHDIYHFHVEILNEFYVLESLRPSLEDACLLACLPCSP